MLTGLDDARNTAKLCHRLVQDGCRLIITKSQWKEVTTEVHVQYYLQQYSFFHLETDVCR